MELTILQITNICLFFTCSYRIPAGGNSIQRECLKCLKAMMSNEFGLDMILLHKDVLMSVAKLINTDSPNVMKVNILAYFVMWQASVISLQKPVVAEIYEMLLFSLQEAVAFMTAACHASSVGHYRVLEAMSFMDVNKHSSSEKFRPMVEGLHMMKENEELANHCLSLITAIITTPEHLDLRIRLRNEFLREGLSDALEVSVCKCDK